MTTADFAIIGKKTPIGDWLQIEDSQEVNKMNHVLNKLRRNNIFSHPKYYNIAYNGYEGDEDFYVKVAESGAVFYCGVGTGRIFAKISQKNSNVTGCDVSKEMIDFCQKKHPSYKSRLIHSSILDLSFPANSFDVVIAPYSFIQYLSIEDINLLGGRLNLWLRPGGKFITDIFSPFLVPFRKQGIEFFSKRIAKDQKIETYVIYDHLKQEMRENTLIQHASRKFLLEMKMYYHFPRETIKALAGSGLQVKAYGGYSSDEFDSVIHDVIRYEATSSCIMQ